MEIKRVCALYYSATGTTDKVCNTIAEAAAEQLELPPQRVAFTTPAERAEVRTFGREDLVVVGFPTYAGRLPNKLLPDIREKLRGEGALAAPVVLFGNRGFDNALAELCAVLEADGFHTVAAGAFVGQHAFTDELAYGRPGWSDLLEAKHFGKSVADQVKQLAEPPAPVAVPGDPDAPYYVPKGEDGAPVNFLKAKPKTNLSRCSRCGACARLCPMGAIDGNNFVDVPGTCIKCQRCVRKCTRGAKYFDDPAYLSHVAMLETSFRTPKENSVFF
jgi:ferredoxin/flavodoxin